MRRRFALPVAVLAWLVLPGPAFAAPELTVEPNCENPAEPYRVTVQLTGWEPKAPFEWSYGTTDGGGAASGTFTADANGTYGPLTFGGGAPAVYTFTVTLPSGEKLEASANADCGEANGGSVSGEGFTDWNVRFTIDARSDPDQGNPTGTVTLGMGGHDLHGTVTCLSANGPFAAVGVAIDDPPAGVSAGQLILISDQTYEDFFQVEPRAAAPTQCPAARSPNHGQVIEGGLSVREAAPDSEPPELNIPDLALVNASRPRGARISYLVWAKDNLDPRPLVECSPPRGVWLTQGWTTVTCTATDYAGNTVTRSFRLVLVGVVAQLQMLEDVVTGYGLDDRTEQRLTFELRQARRSYRKWWPRPACGSLARFTALAERESGHELTPQQAGRVLADAQRIRGAAGCVPPPPPATGPRLTVTDSCGAVEELDYGRGGFGAAIELDGFPPNARVRVDIDTNTYGTAFEPTTDADGHYGPWRGALTTPVGPIVVTAKLWGTDTVLATASLDDLCVAPVYAP